MVTEQERETWRGERGRGKTERKQRKWRTEYRENEAWNSHTRTKKEGERERKKERGGGAQKLG